MNRSSRLQITFLLLCAGSLSPVYLFKTDAIPWLAIGGMMLGILGYLYLAYEIYDDEKLNVSLGYLIGTSLLIRFAAIPTPIFMDAELYRAVWDGWLQQQSMNPYAYLPASQQLSLLHSSTLFQLLPNAGAFTSFNPMQEVLLRITGILYDYFGLGTTILIQKGISALLDIGLIYSLWRAFKQFNRPVSYLLLLAWNPLLILFITGQGLFIQLSAIVFVWIIIQWQQRQQTNTGLLWGGWMLTSPLGWMLWPLSWKKVGYKWVWIPLVTVVVWWLPFAVSADPLHFVIGTLYEWVQPTSNLSLGYALSRILTPINTMWTYGLALCVWLGGFLIAAAMKWKGSGSATASYRDLASYTWIFALGLWFFTPSLTPAIWIILVVSSLLAGRLRFFTASWSALAFCNLWYLHTLSYWPMGIFVVSLLLMGVFSIWGRDTKLGSFLRA
jgi:hypothetical protein